MNLPAAVVILARWILGSVFIYLGMTKALHPVDFLKILRQFGFTENPFGLNLIASALPWFEVFCGMLLVAGIAVRGAAIALLALLLPFSWLVFRRAWTLHHDQGIPFCAVHFDCGCGAGEVMICRKLLENAFLMLLGGLVLVRRVNPWCLRHDLILESGLAKPPIDTNRHE